MHKSLGQDVRDGLILRNVTEAVKVPQVRHKGIEPLSDAFLVWHNPS